MTQFVAFLRAINVGGHVVKMADLRRPFEALGLSNVETFIASGNVIFETSLSAKKAAALERTLEERLQQALGYEVATFLRTLPELVAIAQQVPFKSAELSAGATLYIAFTRREPDAESQRKLLSHRNTIDDFHVHQREIYWLSRKQLGESKFLGATLERALGAPATVRNVTTVRKIAAKYGAQSG